MYQQFFQFRRLPFQLTPDPHFFFFTARHEEAFNQARYCVKERKGFMMLTGEVGTGKTTLSRLLIEHLGPRVKSSLLFNPNLTTVELLQAINRDFGVADQSYSKKILTDALNQFLLEQLLQGGNAVLVVDEAQTLPIECLEEIRLLSNLETPQAKLLQILLVGQPELDEKLALPQLRQLNQRITLRAHLAPLESQEVADYIQYRLWRAGGREAVHFEPAAIDLVFRYSQGVPRLINALCDRALLAAYVRGTRLISGYLMGQAIGELTPILPVLEPPPPHLTREAPAPPPPRAGHPDPTLRVAWFGLSLLVAGLLLIWWRSGSIESRFPMALMAYEQAPVERPVVIEEPPPAIVIPPPDAPPDALGRDMPPPVEPQHQDSDAPAPWEELALKVDHAAVGPSVDPSWPSRPSRAIEPVDAWSLDADGVIRVGRVRSAESTARAAALMLLREWGAVDPSILPQQADPAAVARDHRIEVLRVSLTVDDLLKLNYPAIVFRVSREAAESAYPVVFSRAADGEVMLLDPREGLVRRPVDTVARELTGDVELYWRPLNDWRWPGPIDGADPVIRWLQQRLREQQLYRGPVDGLVGPEIERALRRFAARRGLELPANSPVIELLISQLLGPPDLPLLSPRPAAG